MKRKFFIYTIILTMMLSFGCTKQWLDVNKNPNNAEDAAPQNVFPAAVLSTASVVGGWYNVLGGFWSQYWSQSNSANQFKVIDMYDIPDNYFARQWSELYAGAISDYQVVIDKATKDSVAAYIMMATVMQVYTYATLVDLYDNIPYTEALKGDGETPNFDPKYDNGKEIYLDLIKRLDEVTALTFKPLNKAQKAGDVVFGGDIKKWLQFANTLRLKLYLRMTNSDPAAAQAGVAAAFANPVGFLEEDAAVSTFADKETQSNPLYESLYRKLNVKTNLRISATIYFYYKNNGDPRLDVIVTDSGKKRPMPQGGFNISGTDLSPTDVPVFAASATTPVYFISEIESYLLQAEALARGWGAGPYSDKDNYDYALYADLLRKGFSKADAKAAAKKLTDPGGKYEYPAAGSEEEKLEAIIMAKWAAFVGTQSLESFLETNRTGYPKISAIPAWENGNYNPAYKGGELTYSLEGITGVGNFPKRLMYPSNEVNLNKNCVQTKITDKVWWAK